MDAADVARRFSLGTRPRLSDGPVARGKEGEVWRLDTDEGDWAVKVPFEHADEDAVRRSASFQEDACAAGVPTPLVCRTTDRHVFATIEGRQVRVYEWVDLLAPDPHARPRPRGRGRRRAAPGRPRPTADPRTTGTPTRSAPRGGTGCSTRLHDAGAPFAQRLADLRDELVALECWIEAPRMLRPVPPGPVGGQPAAHGRRRDLRHRLGEQRAGRPQPGARLRAVRVRPRSDPGRARALVDAYRAAGGPAPIDRRGDFSMLIAQLGHITEAGATDWLHPSPRSPERADAEAWMAEVLDEPHTRDVLDGLLAAVTR